MHRQLSEQLTQRLLVVGQRPIDQPLTGLSKGHAMMRRLAHVQADEHFRIRHAPSPFASVRRHGVGVRHPRYEETPPQSGHVPISDPPTPPDPATRPDLFDWRCPGRPRQGQQVMPGLVAEQPHSGAATKVTGRRGTRRCSFSVVSGQHGSSPPSGSSGSARRPCRTLGRHSRSSCCVGVEESGS